MDEADRLLDMDFGAVIDKILKIIPYERRTFLFSATMTTKVAKLQRASLSNPVKLEVSTKCVRSFARPHAFKELTRRTGTRRFSLYCNTTCSFPSKPKTPTSSGSPTNSPVAR